MARQGYFESRRVFLKIYSHCKAEIECLIKIEENGAANRVGSKLNMLKIYK